MSSYLQEVPKKIGMADRGRLWFNKLTMIRKTDKQRGPLGARLYRRRNELGLSQQEVADHVGVSITAYQQWEGGEVESPYPKNIAKAAAILQTTPHYLMTGTYEIKQDELAELRDELAAMRRQLADLASAVQQQASS